MRQISGVIPENHIIAQAFSNQREELQSPGRHGI